MSNELILFYASNPRLENPPLIIPPFIEPEELEKLQVTIRKLGAYLEKAGADQWWKQWLKSAHAFNSESTLPSTG
jgi:hypothetical protein